MTERNEPCPCGSGKKYKRCCGATGAISLPPEVARQRAGAYQGELGQRREAFCRAYTAQKQARLGDISAGLRRDVSAQGKSITCGKGCNPCCHVYVVATLQECEAVVYYLYQHEDVLRHFLKNFAAWRAAVERIRGVFFEISRLQNRRMLAQDTAEDRAAFDAALVAYADEYIPCPFLKDGACSIYEVRPYVCAGLVATTPQEWCQRAHPHHAEAQLRKSDTQMDSDMPYFVNPCGRVMLSCFPALTYEIVSRGWDFLRDVPGFEGLKQSG